MFVLKKFAIKKSTLKKLLKKFLTLVATRNS